MPRHGIGPRRSVSAAASTSESHDDHATITDRPAAARTHPLRNASTLTRGEAGSEPFHATATVDAHAGSGDADDIVPVAYQVIDRYVDDGRKAAESWTHAGEGRTTGSSRPSRDGHTGPAADHLITEAIAALVSTRGLNSAVSALPAVLAALAPQGGSLRALELLIDAAQRILHGGHGGHGGYGGTWSGLGAQRTDPYGRLWEELGDAAGEAVGESSSGEDAPVSTTGWLPFSDED